MSISDLADRLRPYLGDIAADLLGEPSFRTRSELRFGSKRGLVVNLAGPRAGHWHDFSEGVGGDALDLITRELCDRDRALDYAAQWLNEPDSETATSARRHHRPAPVTPTTNDNDRDTRRAALAIWHETHPATGTPVDLYLTARGLTYAIPPTLRFHQRLWHTASRRHWPAMVAKIESVDGAFLGVHRTWLDAGINPNPVGKAPVDGDKMTLGRIKGGAVRLAPAGHRLIVGEGIESTLSAMELAGGWPAWSALSTFGMRALVLPECVRDILIAADNDKNGAGQRAAAKAAERWRSEDRHVTLRLAPKVGDDLNDVLQQKVA